MNWIPSVTVIQEATGQVPSGPADPSQSPLPTSGGSWLTDLGYLPLIAIVGIFYFLVMAPERKARKKREAMLKEIKKGDKVVTTGGMHGTVAAVQDDVITLQIAEGVKVRFSRQAIQGVLEAQATEESAKT